MKVHAPFLRRLFRIGQQVEEAAFGVEHLSIGVLGHPAITCWIDGGWWRVMTVRSLPQLCSERWA